MRNVELARCFRDLAAYLEMEDVPFKPRAYEKASLAIESYDQPLEEVYRRGGVKALRAIPGIGASMADKLEELIKTGKCALREEYRARMPVDIATLTAIEGVGPKAVKVLYDLLAVARKPGAVMQAFVGLPQVARVLGQGDTKSSVKLAAGLQVDLRVVPTESFGAALCYFTGSKAHNVALRQLAIKRGYKLNEYGLFRGARRIAGRTEEEIYARSAARRGRGPTRSACSPA